MNQIPIVWLVPVSWFYWQPTLAEFTKIFPQTTVFTALFPGYAKGYEDSLNLRIVGDLKVFQNKKKVADSRYGSGYTSLSPWVFIPLLKIRPKLIFSNSFGLWTILALMFKPIGNWQVVIAYEGSAPGVDFLDSPFRLSIRKLMVRIADFCISNSEAGKGYLVETLDADPKNVFARPYEIPSAVSLLESRNSLDLNHLTEKKPIFLFVGRLLPRKGVLSLLRTCEYLKKQGYNNYTLLIVGEGDQKEELVEFCKKNQLENCVHLLGRVDYEEISSYYQAADVFVLPTLEDTWGVVTLEVLLFGKAILCSQGAGSAELIEHGINGYVFDPHNREQLASLMKQFIDCSKLAESMGRESRQIIARHTPFKAAQYLAEIVESRQKL